MIWINLGKWSTAGNNYGTWGYSRNRIYFKGYVWTPFIIVKIHKIQTQNGQQMAKV